MLTSVSQLKPADLAGAEGDKVKRFQIEGIDVMALDIPYRQAMSNLQRIRAFLSFMMRACWHAVRVPDVDIVFATSTPLTVGIPALACRWLARHRYVFEVRDVWPAVPIAMGVIRGRFAAGVLTWFERLFYRKASGIVAASPGMEAMIRASKPGNKPIISVTNCSDIDLFHPDIDGAPIRKKHGWENRFVCIHTGAMGKANGLDTVVSAAEHFRDDSEFLFVLVGDGAEKERIRDECKRRGLTNLVVMDGIPKSELPAVIAAADVCMVLFAAVPILEDNSANKFFDSLSAGKPVLLNYSGWQRPVIETAGAGFGCTMGDDAEFCAKLATMKADRPKLSEMGRNARVLAVERFNRDRLAADVLELLARTTDNRPPTASDSRFASHAKK
jgi:glycosyltransferase involved in cell wall biosynthesis